VNDNIDRSIDHAVVLGGSVAGLLAARVLSDAYAGVTVIERDALAPTYAPRRGVPQGRHAHFLLARGAQVLDELFPGLSVELRAAGAPTGDALDDTRMYLSGHLLRRTPTGLAAISVSRGFLEGHIRERVRALPNVRILDRCDVVGLLASSDHRRVTGARVLRRADGSAEEAVRADLLVDATGRGSRAGAWLAALGHAPAPEEHVRMDLGYATRRYRVDDDRIGGDLGILHGLTPAHPRGGGLARLEGGRMLLTLAGLRGDHPPRDPAGFDAFAQSLRFPDIHAAIRDAEPLDDPVAYRFTDSVRRRYDRVRRPPAGFVAMGDSLCSLNPLYGQGMSVAALEALALRRHVRRGVARPRRLLRDLVAITDGPWRMAVGADLAFDGVDGRGTPDMRVMRGYVSRLHAAAADDAALSVAFVRVSALVDPPAALLRPRVVMRLLRRPSSARRSTRSDASRRSHLAADDAGDQRVPGVAADLDQ
jgi:2-polyprenyl-6-methoxyphenol hydroxylase-like FAD-dependent oxidoreductase